MLILAIDTAAGLCAACVHDTQAGERGREVRDIGRGHAEELMAVIETALAQAAVSYGDLDAIAVSVGPGSFTGVRVGVATARGLALALKIPAIGISTLEALAEEAGAGRPVLARIEAGRGQAYVAAFSAYGETTLGPAALGVDDADALVRDAGPDTVIATGQTADIGVYARLASHRLETGRPVSLPKPLYLREVDARPQTAFALPRKGEEP